MTDPNATSDDILSSIRRLVVDEERAGASAVQPARQKLVLTPNLRVVSSTSRPQTAAALQPLHLQNPPRAGLTTPQFVASVAQGIDPQAMDWEPETEAEVPEIDSLDLARFAQARNTRIDVIGIHPTHSADKTHHGQKTAHSRCHIFIGSPQDGLVLL